MTGPLYVQGAFGYQTSLVIAVGIGFLFGFVLERAGFGDSRNLTNIFYFRDMRVLKVMFSAMVTAMIGLIALSWVGLFDYSILVEHTLLKTYLWPQLVGGILFGFGFAIGVLPRNSRCRGRFGQADAVTFMAGMMAGIWVFAWGYPIWGDFYMSSNFGRLTLWQVFGLPKEIVALAIVVMALGAFWLTGLAERWRLTTNHEV